jgi:hypothetical protein
MVRFVTLSKWTAISLAALVLGYFAIEGMTLLLFRHDVMLSWVAPTENEDNSPLTDLAGYFVIYGTEAGHFSDAVVVEDPDATSFTVENLLPGTYYFAMTAFNDNGAQSAPSNTIVKPVP